MHQVYTNHPIRSAITLGFALILLAAHPCQALDPDLAPLPSNFGRVEPGLYRGGMPTAEMLDTLAEMGVRTVLNLRRGHYPNEEAVCRRLEIDYIQIPFNARKQPLETDVTAVLELLRDPVRRPLYVHCLRGKHRTGLMIALHRVHEQGAGTGEAFAEMQHYDFGRGHRRLRRYLFEQRAAGMSDPIGDEESLP